MSATARVLEDGAGAAPCPAAPPLRVLTFLNSLAPGGVERVALRLHAAWTEAGVDTLLVLADGSRASDARCGNVETLGGSRSAIGRFAALIVALPLLVSLSGLSFDMK